jgi:hypothetical protein
MLAVIIAAASVVTATEMDFDGRSAGALRSVNFDISNSEINQEIPEIPAPAIESRKIQDLNIDSMTRENLVKLEHRLNFSIKTAINYCNKNHLDDMRNNFSELLVHGTIKDKNDFVNNPADKYVFHNKKTLGTEILEVSSGQSKGGNPYCVSWGSQQVCVPKQTCNNVCDAGTITCVAVTGGSPICSAGNPICHLICNNTSECHDVPYCTQWETEVI